MLATRYTYSLATVDNTVVITLKQNNSNAEKVFRIVGVPVECLTLHMESMTDECCDGYWPKRKKK